MGNDLYDRSVTRARIDDTNARGASYFAHDTDIREGRTAERVHPLLDPSRKNAAGNNVRESFDSPAHPASLAIATIFDVTGSMSEVPEIFKAKFPELMGILTDKQYVADPHVLFGAVGDAYSDKVPLQIGQFEAGNAMDNALANIYLEGNGGGQNTESYDLALYYMARHTDLDCIKRRNKKGYLFLTGDELFYPHVSKRQVKDIIGDTIQSDIPIADILAEVREKFEVFWIMPGGTNNFTNKAIRKAHKDMFGKNFLLLQDPNGICELIAGTIAINEGKSLDSVNEDLRVLGFDDATITRNASALRGLAADRAGTPIPDTDED